MLNHQIKSLLFIEYQRIIFIQQTLITYIGCGRPQGPHPANSPFTISKRKTPRQSVFKVSLAVMQAWGTKAVSSSVPVCRSMLRSKPTPKKKQRAQPLHHSKCFACFCKRIVFMSSLHQTQGCPCAPIRATGNIHCATISSSFVFPYYFYGSFLMKSAPSFFGLITLHLRWNKKYHRI